MPSRDRRSRESSDPSRSARSRCIRPVAVPRNQDLGAIALLGPDEGRRKSGRARTPDPRACAARPVDRYRGLRVNLLVSQTSAGTRPRGNPQHAEASCFASVLRSRFFNGRISCLSWIQQAVEVHDEVTHMRVVDGLLRLAFQATWAGRIVGVGRRRPRPDRDPLKMFCSRSTSSPRSRGEAIAAGALSGMVVSLRKMLRQASFSQASFSPKHLVASHLSKGAATTLSGHRAASKMRDDARMTIASRGTSTPCATSRRCRGSPRRKARSYYHSLPAHQIRRGKIPIAALTAGKGGIEAALRDPAEPKR